MLLFHNPKLFADDHNGIKTLLANGLITFFIDGNPAFNNRPRSQPIISVDCFFAKALRRFATCLTVNNDLCGKLVSSLELPIIFDDNLKTTSVSLFIADFNLSSFEFDSFIFKLLY